MENVATVAPAAEQEQHSWRERVSQFVRDWKKVAALGGIIVAAAAYTAGRETSGSGIEGSAAALAAGNLDPNCDNLTLTNVADQYPAGKFLPAAKGGIGNANEAADYTQGLFGKSGPLGGTADRASESIIDTVIAHPALESGTNNSYSYSFQFEQDMNKLNGPNADTTAKELCKDNYEVMSVTAGYDANAIASEEQYTRFTAINGKSDITGLKMEHNTAPKEGIGGATYQVQNQSNKENLHGITEVVIEADGSIDVKGWLPTGGNKNANQPTPNGNKHRQHQGEGGGERHLQRHGNGGGNNNETNRHGSQGGGTTHPGKSPERNPGPNRGPSRGPVSGPNHGAQPGPEKTPSGGGGGGGGKPPTGTTPPPIETTPPPTTTTPPPTTTQPPTTTELPPKDPPGPLPPPPTGY